MSTPVTDPAILEQLNGPKSGPVTDPHILAKLNADDRSTGATVGGYAKAAASGLGEGVAHTASLPMDLYNLVGTGLLGRGPAWLTEKAGFPETAEGIRKHGYKDIYWGSGQGLTDTQTKMGLNYQPVTPGEQATKDSISGATTGGLTALLTGGAGNLAQGANIGKQVIAGTGGVVGGKLAGAANEATGEWIPQPLAEIIGSIFGGFGAGGVANRSSKYGLYEPTARAQDFKEANVTPHFPSDVAEKPGMLGRLLSDWLPNRTGAQGVTTNNAKETQKQLSKYAEGLFPDRPSLQTQGTDLQTRAVTHVQKLKDEIDGAYTQVRSSIQPDLPVPTTNTAAAINDLFTRAGGDPVIEKIIANPTFTRLAGLKDVKQLTYTQVDLLRQEIGASMDSASLTGGERGLLKKVYGAISDDTTSALSSNPEALKRLNLAKQTWETNTNQIDDLTKHIVDKVSPETIPDWLSNQTAKGSSRLDAFSALRPDEHLLGNAAQKNGEFDLASLMRFWKSRSPEGQAALTANPDLSDGMLRVARLFDDTEKSRALAGRPAKDIGMGALTTGGLAGGSVLALGHPGLATAASIAPSAAAWGASKLTGALSGRMATPITGDMIPAVGVSQALRHPIDAVRQGVMHPIQSAKGLAADPTLQGIAGSSLLFPDVYSPKYEQGQQHAELPTGADVQQYLATADRPTAKAYIAQRLGPEIANQIPDDDNGYRAALWSLSADPNHRKALTG